MTDPKDISGDAKEAKTEQAFENYDLKAEAPEARKPSIRFAFEFQALLEKFIPADKEALALRKQSRIAGIAAVVLVLAALLLASLGPLIAGEHAPAGGDHAVVEAGYAATHAVAEGDHGSPGLNVHAIIGLIAAVMGLAGTLLGLSGMRRSASRRKWLHARLTTETLRLFHFHYMAARLPELASIGTDAAKQKAYLDDRAAAMARLQERVLNDPEKELQRIVARDGETAFEAITPMMSSEGGEITQPAADAFAAWRVLRVDWQGGYCAAKLEHRHKGRTTTKQLEEIFAGLGWFCVGAIILIHIGHFVGMLAQMQLAILEVAVIWIALIALAGRAMEDGFQPQREIERYEQYRANVRVATERFDAATTFSAKLDAIRSFERSSLEEMRVFLRTHARARFLL